MNINAPTGTFMVLPGMRALTTDPDHPGERRLRGLEWMPNRVRNLVIAMIGEFVGTFLFLFFAFAGTQIANAAPVTPGGKPNTSVLLYISLSFGFSLLVNAWIFFRISGGLFNPAVTLGLCLIGAVGWIRGAFSLISQIAGAMAAAGVASALFPGPLAVRTTLTAGTSVVRGLFIEMFLTAELVFCIFMLAAEKHKATFLAPIGIGISLFIAELAGVYYTGGSLNPARSFGPDVVLRHFDGYHWIYWVGPFLGALIAVIFYRLVKVLEYETANPGQDFSDQEAAEFDPDDEPADVEDVQRPVPMKKNYSESKKRGSGESKYRGSEEKPRRQRSAHTSHNSQSHNSQNNTQGQNFGSRTGPQGRGRDGTDEVSLPPSHDRCRRNNTSQSSGQSLKPEMVDIPGRPSKPHTRNNRARSLEERNADAYAAAARAVYPPTTPTMHLHGGDATYSERDRDFARYQSRAQARPYAHGPDAESGSAGYSDDTTAPS
ncbi:aquaporin-like protein [Mytilinidion resinicola]|uniref:Aquaporin-like protein n=1 Tax=Mytilinidion resinicola TaxID=574789 RepID=A0A6A6YF91_9PEZI|nr:aquaporin-like protein [Mytilinidion resinicola]KAF2807461.1 aquaporin-like protein [Mytilinidion resinicola]